MILTGSEADDMKIFEINIKQNGNDIRKARAGDIIYISGNAFTCRSKLQRAVFDEGLHMPIDLLKNDILIHAGPIIRKKNDEYELISFMPTSSVRFEKWGSPLNKGMGT